LAYDVVGHIRILRYRTSNLRHRKSARIQMTQHDCPARLTGPGRRRPGPARSGSGSVTACQAASGSLPPRYRRSDLRYRRSTSISKTSISYTPSISTFATSISTVDIEGVATNFNTEGQYSRSPISKPQNLWFQSICRYRIHISYPISKVHLIFDIEDYVLNIGHDIGYNIGYCQ
jgi:hypothetical protein